MSDEKDGLAENDGAGAKPVAGSGAISGRTRAAPVIEGQAVEIPAGESEPAPSERAESANKAEGVTLEADAPASEAAGASETGIPTPETSAEEPQRKSGGRRALGAVAALLALGAGGFYGWTEFGGKKAVMDKFAALTGSARPDAAMAPGKANSSDKQAETPAAPETTKKAEEAPAAAPEKEARAVEQAPAENTEVKPKEQPAPVAAPADQAETSAPASPAPGATAKKADESPAPAAAPAPEKGANSTESAPAAAPAGEKTEAKSAQTEAKSAQTEAKPTQEGSSGGANAELALAEMAARLSATQSALEQVSQRLKAVEGQLAAPKADARAALAARDAGPANTGDASARIVAAQSLLAALRQGDDYAPMLAALQNLGGDSSRLARLRAGLTSPSPAKLAEDFAALAPKIAASAAPAAPQQAAASAPKGFGEAAWAFLEVRLKKMVKIRPANAPDQDATAARIDRVEKDLARNDIAGALAERAQLPAPALAVTADWASAAQRRLDAEESAKAELAAALQNLSKSKS